MSAMALAGLRPLGHAWVQFIARMPAGRQPEDMQGEKSDHERRYIRRSTIFFLISAIALAGFKPFGQVCVQFMIVWQR